MRLLVTLSIAQLFLCSSPFQFLSSFSPHRSGDPLRHSGRSEAEIPRHSGRSEAEISCVIPDVAKRRSGIPLQGSLISRVTFRTQLFFASACVILSIAQPFLCSVQVQSSPPRHSVRIAAEIPASFSPQRSGDLMRHSGRSEAEILFVIPDVAKRRSGTDYTVSTISSYKSFISGFRSLINSIFQDRFHFFNCFSRSIASVIRPKNA